MGSNLDSNDFSILTRYTESEERKVLDSKQYCCIIITSLNIFDLKITSVFSVPQPKFQMEKGKNEKTHNHNSKIEKQKFRL